MGIKPLYYSEVDGPGGRRTLLIASEIRALLRSGLVPRQIDPTALATFVWNGFVNGPDTMVRGVRSFASGATATVSADEVRVNENRYWSPPRTEARDEAVEELREELAAAVRLRLVSDVPLGVFLSGGVDSSVVAALASGSGDGEVRTFSVGFEEPAYDESGHASAVAEALGTRHMRIVLTQRAFRDQLPGALDSIDQPTFDQLNTYMVSRAVRNAGMTVALAGVGGDELFGGYSSFVDLPLAARWAGRLGLLPQSVLAGLSIAAARWKLGRPGEVRPQVRWGKLADALATRGDVVDLYQVHYALFTESFYAELLNERDPGVAYGLSDERRRDLATLVASSPVSHAVSLLELSCFVGERLLRDCDAASMSVGLELRVPLLDHRVVEAVAAIPCERRFAPAQTKQLLKDLSLGGLDPKLFERPKAGFVLPIEVWLRQELRDEVDETLMDADLCARAGLSPGAVSRLWTAFQCRAPGIYWSRVWALYVLLYWCRRHGMSV
jgi:asparagine synthase (glutamine-hydrolysing)